MKPVNKEERMTLTELTIQDIKNVMVDHQLKNGDQLPSERELSSLLKVSRSVIREALRSLHAVGMIEIKHGGGAFVRTGNLFKSYKESLPFYVHAGNNRAEIPAVLSLIEKEAITQLFHRSTSEEMEHVVYKLENILAKGTCMKFSNQDREFHYQLIHFLDNEIVVNLWESTWDYFTQHTSVLQRNEQNEHMEHLNILNEFKKCHVSEIMKLISNHYCDRSHVSSTWRT